MPNLLKKNLYTMSLNKLFNNSFIQIYYYLFFFIIICLIFYLKNSQYDFLFFSDQDHVHIYEALIFNSGKSQTYYDHPGFICFFLLGLWLKTIHLLNLINFSDLSYAKYDLNDLNELIYYAKIFNLLICFTLIYFLNRLQKLFIKDLSLRFLIMMIFILSASFFGLLVRIRTEVYSILFFIIFIETLLLFINNTDIKKLFLSGILIVFALSAKVQIILLIFIAPIIAYLAPIKNNNQLNVNKLQFIVSLIVFIIGINMHIGVFSSLIYFYQFDFDFLSHIYLFATILILSISTIEIKVKQISLNIFKDVFYRFIILSSGLYSSLLVISFLNFSTFETIFVILTPLEKLFSFSGGSKTIERVFSPKILSDISFLIKMVDFQTICILFFIIACFIYGLFKKLSIKIFLLLPLWILIKLALTFRYGQHIPSYYLIYCDIILFLLLIFITNLLIVYRNTLKVFLILMLIASFYNFFSFVVSKIDKEKSQLDFCAYKEEIRYANYYSNYYCN